MEHQCTKEKELAELAVTMKFTRDALDEIKKSIPAACLVAGIIGGLVGKLTPEFFNFLIRSVFAGQP